MGWRFWKKRTTVLEEGSVEGAVTDAAPEIDADTPRVGLFHFDSPEAATPPSAGPTLQAPAAAPAPEDDVAAVVRRKVRRTGRRPVLDFDALGVVPLAPPSLREVALLYREAARQRAATRPDEAIEFWRAYLDLSPSDGGAWTELGQALLAAQRFEAAWGAFVEARQLDPLDPLPAGALGFLSVQSGDFEAAVSHYAEATRLSPGTPALLHELANAQGRAGDAEGEAATRARLADLLDAAE